MEREPKMGLTKARIEELFKFGEKSPNGTIVDIKYNASITRNEDGQIVNIRIRSENNIGVDINFYLKDLRLFSKFINEIMELLKEEEE